MVEQHNVIVSEWNTADTQDREDLIALLADYHLQTEAEKGKVVGSADALPARYRFELSDPQIAFAGDVVLLARYEGHTAGCLIISTRTDQRLEIKRLWTAPNYRGRHIATSLLNAAHAHAAQVNAEAIQLSVWEWRANAIALYKKAGFIESPSWEERDQLICMVQAL